MSMASLGTTKTRSKYSEGLEYMSESLWVVSLSGSKTTFSVKSVQVSIFVPVLVR